MSASAQRRSLVRPIVFTVIGLALAVLAGSMLVAAIGDVRDEAAIWGWRYWAVPASVVLPALATLCGLACAVIEWRRPRTGWPAWLMLFWFLLSVVFVFLPLHQ